MIYQRVPVLVWWNHGRRQSGIRYSYQASGPQKIPPSTRERPRTYTSTSTSILHHCTRHLVDTIITIRYIYIHIHIYKVPWMISIPVSSMVVPSHRHMHRTTTSIPPQQQRPRPLPTAIDLILPYH